MPIILGGRGCKEIITELENTMMAIAEVEKLRITKRSVNVVIVAYTSTNHNMPIMVKVGSKAITVVEFFMGMVGYISHLVVTHTTAFLLFEVNIVGRSYWS